MSETDGTPTGGEDFEEFLRKFLGREAGEEAARAMHAQGMDPSALNSLFSSPAQMNQMLSQFQFVMDQTEGPVNWRLAKDMATQQAYQSGDPALSAAEGERARQAMTVADLWLDAVTDFSPGIGQRAAWTRIEWVSHTLPMWQRITEPVAVNVQRALTQALSSQFGEASPFGGDLGSQGIPEGLPPGIAAMMGRAQEMMPKLAAMMFASQIGQALAALSQEAMSSTDVGLPLAPEHTSALVVRNVGAFTEGLDIAFDEVQQFMAVRETAHQRLFASVPWLTGDLIRAVESYSAEISIDTEAIAQAAAGLDPTNPDSVKSAMSQGVIASEPTQRQRAALERLETLLALVEGWVEVVTARAVAPYLPHADQLRELMRRRRAAGGPAEQMMGSLLGLEMRPRRSRGAAKVFALVEEAQGRAGREALWHHPDMVPTAEELDAPDSYLTGRAEQEALEADIDDELTRMLDGTLGWAEGLSPEVDPEADSLRRAGLLPQDGSADEDDPDGEEGEDSTAR